MRSLKTSLFLGLLGTLSLLPLHATFTLVAPAGSFDADLPVYLAEKDLEDRQTRRVFEASTNQDGSLQLPLDFETGLYELAVGELPPLELAPADGQTLRLTPPAGDSDWKVIGSPDTTLLSHYDAFRKESLARLVYPARAAIKDAKAQNASEQEIARLTQIEVDAYKAHLQELNDFTIESIGPTAALYATSLRWDADYRTDELLELLDQFEQRHGTVAVAQKMRHRLDTALSLSLGKIAPPLAGDSLDDKSIALSDFRGQYVLIDFWASWCPPCRVENRHYNDLMTKVSDDAFTILAVNLDTNEQLWSQASRRDRITWPQISDLLGLKSPLAAKYAVTALPKSFLVDPQGRIIAKDLRGPALTAKLRELSLLD